jgi:hypothetical protein
MGKRKINSDIKKPILLVKQKPKRLFTFGCSFTSYHWLTWPEIVAYDLHIPLYNFGLSGAGNQFIFNMLMQAINRYNINESDLVIICWTNVCREDRRLASGWLTPGNLFTADSIYDTAYLKKWATYPEGYAIRDFAVFDASRRVLKNINCQFSMLSMISLTYYNQWTDDLINLEQLDLLYQTVLDQINPSFYEVLWWSDHQIKKNKDHEKIGPDFIDGHPSPAEHLDYLIKTFTGHVFNKETIDQVNLIEDEWIGLLKNANTKNPEDLDKIKFSKLVDRIQVDYI